MRLLARSSGKEKLEDSTNFGLDVLPMTFSRKYFYFSIFYPSFLHNSMYTGAMEPS